VSTEQLTEERVREIVREEFEIITNEALRDATHEALKILHGDGLFRGHIEFPDRSESA
jgi:hypothetical protein